METFKEVLRTEFSIPTTVRKEMGQDISGACGQLVVEYQQGQRKGVQDIEEVAAKLSLRGCSGAAAEG